jgi:hypothetical protein
MSYRIQLDSVPRRAQALMLAGGAVHVAYGAGALLAPERMVSAQYAPDTHGLPDPRLLLRAFGGHLLITGAIALTATRSPRHARPAAALCLLINTLDVTSTILELHTRGHADQTIKGAITLSSTAVLTFAAALHTIPHQHPPP